MGASLRCLRTQEKCSRKSDYNKLSPLNVAPPKRDWWALGGFLPHPDGDQGCTAAELDQFQFQFQSSNDPVKRMMDNWLPTKVATTAALKTALEKIQQHKILEDLGLE